MKTALKVIGTLVLVLVFVIGGAIFALPYLFSTDFVKGKVAELVEHQTGRRLDINGDTSFKLFPNIAVSLDDIALANPKGMEGAPLVRMKSLRANLKLMPLLRGQTIIDSLSLIRPKFNFLVDKKGHRNWEFAKPARTATDTQKDRTTGHALTLGRITVKDGVVLYDDQQKNQREEVKNIHLQLSQNSASRVIEADGNLRWHNEILNITSHIAKPDLLIAGQASDLMLRIKSRLTESQFDGTINPAGPSLSGKLFSDTPSLRRLVAYLGHELPANDGFGELKIRAKVKANGDQISFHTSQFLFDNMDLVANGTINLKGPRPNIELALEADRLNLNLYSGKADSSSGTSDATDKDNPVDLSVLKTLDGHIRLKTKEILYGKARLGEGQFDLTVEDGRANARIDRLSLYRGSATGKLVLDGSHATPFIGASYALQNVLTGAILRDFTGFDKLAGKGNLSGDFTTRGNSVSALKKALKGTSKLVLSKGRIEGFDLAKYVEGLTGNKIPGAIEGYKGKPTTAFDKMSALIRINKGIARNKDFLLTGKFFRVRAAGTIDIPNKKLRLRLAPKLFSGDWKFAPPLRVTGNWTDPHVQFDTLAFLGGTKGVLRSVTGLLNGEKVDLGSVLKNRGLQTDEEIETYLSGKKIDTSHDQPVPDTTSGPAPANGNASAPLGGVLDGLGKKNGGLGGLLNGSKKKGTKELLKNLFQ